jgi:hypothetical protein
MTGTGQIGQMGGTRTIIIFLDIPTHLELNFGYMPLLDVGTEVIFEFLTIKDPVLQRSKIIDGPYYVKRRVLKFGTTSRFNGLTQYLEFEPSKK